MERIKGVLKERNHGVLVAGVQLVTAIVESNPKVRPLFFFFFFYPLSTYFFVRPVVQYVDVARWRRRRRLA